MIRKLLLCAAAALQFGCLGSYSMPRVNMYEVKSDALHPATYAGIPARSGQIVLTESPEATSLMFILIPDRFYYFTHAGIVVMEEGEPWVYEINAEIVTFPFHSRVLDNVDGKVMKRRLMQYVSPNLYAEIMDVEPGVDGEKVAAFAREHFKKKTAFDAFFHWDEHEKLYCTEFVELALRAGGAKPHDPGPALEHPSLAVGKRWLEVPEHESMPAANYYDPNRMVAAMGQFPTRTSAGAYFEAKHELYRRFSKKDQRLGYLFGLKSTGNIELRDEVMSFLENAAQLFNDVKDPPPFGDTRIERAVRRYADRFFGPAAD
jgi:hypothetical protein